MQAMDSSRKLTSQEIGKTIYMLVGGLIGVAIFFVTFRLIDRLPIKEKILYACIPFIIFLAFWSMGRLTKVR